MNVENILRNWLLAGLLCAAIVAGAPNEVGAAPSVIQTIDLSSWAGPVIAPTDPPLPPAPHPGFSLTSLAYDPVLHMLYVVDSETAYVYQIDTRTNAIQAVVNTQGLAVPAGQLDLYVPLTVLANPASGRWAVMSAYFGSKFTGTTWDLLDGIPAGTIQQGASWSPVTDTVYSANVNFFAMQNRKFLYGVFPCAGTSFATTFNPATSRVSVSCGFSDSNAGIYDFDGVALLKADKHAPPPPIGSAIVPGTASRGALGLATNPNTNRLYASALSSPDSLDVFDASTHQRLASIPGLTDQSIPRLPQPIAVNTQTDTIFVLNAMSSTISLFDGKTNSLMGTLSIPIPPGAIIDDPPFGTKIGNVYFDPTRNNVRTTLGGAVAMAVNEADNLLYVASVNGTVSVIALDPPNGPTTFSISGLVKDAQGVVQAGLPVTANGATGTTVAVTDAQRLFVLTGMGAGVHKIVPIGPDETFAPQAVIIDGQNVSDLAFRATLSVPEPATPLAIGLGAGLVAVLAHARNGRLARRPGRTRTGDVEA